MRRTYLILLVGVFALAGGALLWYWTSVSNPSTVFQTAAVKRGNLLATVSATGTIEPEEVVDIGAQVVGMIQELGRDPYDSSKVVDYGSTVEAGTILARIDDALYRARLHKAVAQVEQSKAQIEQTQADLRRAEADLLQTQAKDLQAARDWERAQKLAPSRAISDVDFDNAKATHEVAKANLAVAEAAIDQARASKLKADKALMGAQADQQEAQKNLDYTTIRSPVKGVVIDRRVNVGQTVVSSLNAPSLFLIAKDLKRLQVWASVNEADIGRIKPGQMVRFSVDAFSDEVFNGVVSQVRLNATMTQNVVTYTVVVVTDNSSGRLLPYLTANARFEIDRRSSVLLVPNAALRWQPQRHDVLPAVRDEYVRGQPGTQAKGELEAKADETTRHDRGLVWIKENTFVRPVEVRIGLSDGILTEVVGGDLREGQPVVMGEVLRAEADDTVSPFAPRLFGGGQR